MRKRLFVLVLAMGLMLSVAACSKDTDDASAAAAVTEITLCESWDFEAGFYTIGSPDSQQNYGALYWGANFYETLVNYENGEFVPGLAESWEVSDDGTVYTFKLRKNVKFSDGSDFTAEAVKKSFEAAPVNLGQYNGSYGTLTTIFKEIVCVDEYTVELRLTQPYYGTLKDLTILIPLAIVNPAMLGDDLKPTDAFAKATHGTGPYMYAGDGDGSTYTFVRNPYYWGEKPALDEFKVKVIPDNSAKLLALKSGEIDAILGADLLSIDGYNEMKSLAGFDVAISPPSSYTRILGFNLSHAGFDDLVVRAALASAIDKDALCASVLSGIETRADSLFPKSYPYCNVDLTPLAYDVAAAQKSLEDAGWKENVNGIREKDGVILSGTLIYISGNAVVEDLVLTIVSQAKEIGIELIPKGGDMMAYYADLYGDFGVTLYNTYGPSYDPFTMVANMNPELGVDPMSANAIATLPDPAELIRELNATADEQFVLDTYKTILTTVNNDVTILPISESKALTAYNGEKIAEVGFNSDPRYVNVSKITPK
jgi:nickel transport system substrate-binding protein